jgi:hypothetical protein
MEKYIVHVYLRHQATAGGQRNLLIDKLHGQIDKEEERQEKKQA